ncbi:hydroxyacylglutathione hydrolase [Motilimonas eburnea]|uniref:hydroxyacylglutathione hydrolase n=1 Tax=Motilimonas eburnea TaxID=1737488 RepID=UPI001E37CE2D|nr:hydroxyacylglutathione hydrolase [Motilimonas eburnea]MCE2571610.1 hydroxyacylglutathione hydrolase [Motilimonas eburnea]
MIQVLPIPAFNDNYIWLIKSGPQAAILVDPGDGQSALAFLKQHNFTLNAILLTHYHLDHGGGVAYLQQHLDHPIAVYGPKWQPTPVGKKAPQKRCPDTFIEVGDGDSIVINQLTFNINAVPGHTLEHINYVLQDEVTHVFCGDSLFSGGCGRVFEGTMGQMYHSVSAYGNFPDDTQLYPAHEYTLSNLAFAHQVEPDNQHITDAIKQVAKLRQQGIPTLPVTVAHEKRINPFMRCEQASVLQAVQVHFAEVTPSPEMVFSQLRKWKDES